MYVIGIRAISGREAEVQVERVLAVQSPKINNGDLVAILQPREVSFALP
jgi:hypothetical protein